MATTQSATRKPSKKEVHESLKEKLQHALSDFGHMVHEIDLKKIVHDSATFISNALHKKPEAPKKGAKKATKNKEAAHAAESHAAKKAIVKTAAKKSAKKKK